MDKRKLVRDGERVTACMKELPDESLVAVKAVKMYAPARYAEHGLAQIGIETYVCGIVMYVVEEKFYAMSEINAMIRITPTSTLKINVDGDDYYEFYFEPGSVITPSLQLVRTDTLVYKIFDELMAKGRVPSYLQYNDMVGIFDSARKHAGANVGGNREVTEMLVSLIARNPSMRSQYYRQYINALLDKIPNPTEADIYNLLVNNPPPIIWTALYSVTDSATNTLNKLAGSYFHEGVVSALNSPAERTERIEDLLRR